MMWYYVKLSRKLHSILLFWHICIWKAFNQIRYLLKAYQRLSLDQYVQNISEELCILLYYNFNLQRENTHFSEQIWFSSMQCIFFRNFCYLFEKIHSVILYTDLFKKLLWNTTKTFLQCYFVCYCNSAALHVFFSYLHTVCFKKMIFIYWN